MIDEQPQISRTFGVTTDPRSTGLPEPQEELSFTLPDLSLAGQLDLPEVEGVEESAEQPVVPMSPRFSVTADPRHTGLPEE